MAEWWSTALGAGILLASYTATAVAYLLYAVLYLLSLVVWPITALYGLALVIFAPAIYTIQFAFTPFSFALSIIPKLEALYIFFGCAAFVGILAGTTVRLTSGVFTSVLGIHGPDETPSKPSSEERQVGSGSFGGSDLLEDEHSSQDSDSIWYDSQLERTIMPKPSRRRMPGLLLRETIHEEEDDL
ncbi:hypothetical protein GQ53DRAFT_749968 [Thozetella sp. PMI_491]|nr:hypothetical protein GQ53DRAFT_749968 [Thozetella sp. PMI_491]